MVKSDETAWCLFLTDAAKEQLYEDFLVKVTRQRRAQLGCRRVRGKVRRKNWSACFYQEYANKCMLDGDTSRMWILSSGATAHANVLIGHFVRQSAMPQLEHVLAMTPCTACLLTSWSHNSTQGSVSFNILWGSSRSWVQQKHCEVIQIPVWEEENKIRFWCFRWEWTHPT